MKGEANSKKLGPKRRRSMMQVNMNYARNVASNQT